MKTLLILFVAILGYVHCVFHTCDRLAVNIKTSAKDDGSNRGDSHNQIIDLGELLQHKKVESVVGRASSRHDLDSKYARYCSTVTFVDGCGAIRYARDFIIDPALPKDPSGNYYGKEIEEKISMNLESLGINIKTNEKVRIEHTAVLINRDDLIFQVKEDTIKFKDEQGNIIPADHVQNALKTEMTQEFAINRLIKDEKTQEIVAVVFITCNEEWAWAAYTKKIVDENKEGKYAKEIEEVLLELDVDHNKKIQEDANIPDEEKENEYKYEEMKPVSTSFPQNFKYKTIVIEAK